MITCADGSITSCLCVCQQLVCLCLHTAEAQLQLGQLSQGVLVVLQLLLDPRREALKGRGSLHATAQAVKALSDKSHPLIQLGTRKVVRICDNLKTLMLMESSLQHFLHYPSILTCVNRGRDSSSRLAVSLTRSLMALC